MTFKKIAIALFSVAVLTAGVAEAKKLVVKNFPVEAFPGIDADGDLDGEANLGLVKIALNLKNGKLSISGKASVDNLSGKKAVFKNENFVGIDELVKDKYTVSKKGKASYSGKFIVEVPDFDMAAL